MLDLFTLDDPAWTVDQLVVKLDMARATVYRYVKALTDSGFLVPTSGNAYVLGPRFIEFDRNIRLADPLLQIAPPIMARMRDRVPEGMQLLCRSYGDRVLCIHQEAQDPGLRSRMDRGRPFTLFLGGPSRTLLAHLPSYRLRTIMLHHAKEIAAAGLGESWEEFRDALREIRADGYYLSQGELDNDKFGVSAPIFRAADEVTASLTVCLPLRHFVPAKIEQVSGLVKKAAREISERLQAGELAAKAAVGTRPRKTRALRPRRPARPFESPKGAAPGAGARSRTGSAARHTR